MALLQAYQLLLHILVIIKHEIQQNIELFGKVSNIVSNHELIVIVFYCLSYIRLTNFIILFCFKQTNFKYSLIFVYTGVNFEGPLHGRAYS